MVQPAIKLGRPPPAPIKVSTRPSTTSTVAKHLLQARQYPVASEPPVNLQDKNVLPGRVPLHHGAILRLCFSGAPVQACASLPLRDTRHPSFFIIIIIIIIIVLWPDTDVPATYPAQLRHDNP